uniref:RNA-dependent RNA polymerase n=1 Tax=Rhizoctonia solani partitivirus 9 TaxID=2741542 RepID=A0A6N0UMM2_9VIRU|nr:RNA-dependent RNA polymerase [Rhizoctonia solani partitivirus 9]
MLTFYTTAIFCYFIRVWKFKTKHKKFDLRYYNQIRNIYIEYKFRESSHLDDPPFVYSKSILTIMDKVIATRYAQHHDDILDGIREHRITRDLPLGLYDLIEYSDIPDLRLPKPGILVLPIRYHEKSPGIGYTSVGERLLTNEPDAAEEPLDRKAETYIVDLDLSGFPPNPEIVQIIYYWFPQYLVHLDYYCRPYSFGPQAFYDFNRTTDRMPPPSYERETQILELIDSFFNIKPYQPIHFAETLASGIPLSTSAPFAEKHDPESIALARWNSPSIYASRPSSKGHFINSILTFGRRILHNIKETGTPNGDPLLDALLPDSDANSRLQNFFIRNPTELFIRTQISKRDPSEPKKIRPVYSVCLLFILFEIMLTYPLLAQLRNPECCVLHGLETFRGSMNVIDSVAMAFTSYVSLDWSQFDQRLPIYVIITYYTRFLPRRIVINKGYTPSHSYPDTRFSNMDTFAIKIFNLLQFLLLWYLNMVFISYDGYAYVRLNGGVPSGLLNTQSLDSFGNLYIIIDSMLEFGFTKSEILDMIFFIMGDDNIFFARMEFNRICDFMKFLDSYAKTRHGMVLSILKSTFTRLRSKIEVLGYTNNFGKPTRPIGKLVAQLAFPERPVPEDKQWLHAARALGLAYASCAQNATFHSLCYEVYKKFKPSEPVPSAQIKRVFKYTVSELFEFELDTEMFTFPDFPSLYDISNMLNHYHGFFSEEDKWQRNIFADAPHVSTDNAVTLEQWLASHPSYQFKTDHVMQGSTAP